ncbi:MAG: hypothetical protein BWY63_00435 [Chloroflexi bacterium ADurb.Bin360]|nr:MAG: hypothetical protein BWY63_00435 [Chloroflexi bacterium ADurb.Bin360]
MLKHFEWSDFETGERGRVGVLLESEMLEIFQVSGKAMPANALAKLLAMLGDEFITTANAAAARRANAFAVDYFRGMSGCRTYVLRVCEDARRGIYRRAASVHVSMYGKVNEEIKCWIADLLPILNSGGAEFTGSAASIEEVEVKYNPRNFHHTKLGAVIVDGELHIIDAPEYEGMLTPETMERLMALDFSGDEPDLSEA